MFPYYPAFSRLFITAGPVSIPGQSVWDFFVDNASLGRVILCVLLFPPSQSYPTHAPYSLIYHPVDGQCVRGRSSTHSLAQHDYNKNLERNISFSAWSNAS